MASSELVAPGRRSTRSTRAASPTPTATASATSRASPPGPVPGGTRDRRGLAQPVLPVGARRRRLRRRRLPRRRPALGTLADFDEMSRRAARRGHQAHRRHRAEPHLQPARLVQEALASPRGPRRASGTSSATATGQNGELPPSDWASVFGGRLAWHAASADGQWYLHMFAEEQPDLNWANREVRDDFLKTLRFWADRGVDGFRVDVAHGLTKDLTEPLPSPGGAGRRTDADSRRHRTRSGTATKSTRSTPSGARSSTNTTRRGPPSPRPGCTPAAGARYASPQGLGQAFNFDLLQADFDADEFREIITDNLAEATESGASSTWVFSNHDVVRHATRYGLPRPAAARAAAQDGKAGCSAGSLADELDVDSGLRRARAATLLMLALPGSAYLYQGEELGLHEVGGHPDAERSGPHLLPEPAAWRRAATAAACRCPGRPTDPRSASATAPRTCRSRPGSAATPSKRRRRTPTAPPWSSTGRRCSCAGTAGRGGARHGSSTGDADVLHFGRPGGWRSVTNFGPRPVPLPHGSMVVASGPLQDGLLPADTTAWIIPTASAGAASCASAGAGCWPTAAGTG